MSVKNKKLNLNKLVYNLPIYIWFLGAICIILIIATIISAGVIAHREPKVKFIPPEFDAEAVIGTPELPKEYAYKTFYQEPMTFSTAMCGTVFQEDGRAVIYFTNSANNKNVWLKLRIYSNSNEIIGESGLIKPGEYIRSVLLNNNVEIGTNLKMKIMSYEPETYSSMGSVTINTVMQDKINK